MKSDVTSIRDASTKISEMKRGDTLCYHIGYLPKDRDLIKKEGKDYERAKKVHDLAKYMLWYGSKRPRPPRKCPEGALFKKKHSDFCYSYLYIKL